MPIRRTLVLLLAAALFAAGCSVPHANAPLKLSGTVDTIQVDVASQIPGQVLSLPDEGQTVRKNAVIVRLDVKEYQDRVKQAQAALDSARQAVRQARLNAEYRAAAAEAGQHGAGAGVNVSRMRVDQARHQLTLEGQRTDALIAEAQAQVSAAREAVEEARARVREAQTRAQLADRDRQRNEDLLKQGFIPPQRADQTRTAAIQAHQQVTQAMAGRDQAAAGLRQAQAHLDEARSLQASVRAREAQVAEAESSVEQARAQYQSARSEDVRVRAAWSEVHTAAARVKEAEAALALARTQLAHGVLKAPVDGIVSEKIVEAGEQITPGQPLLRVSRLSRVWVDVYVPEDRLHAVWLGMKARIQADVAGGSQRAVEGTLTFLSPDAEFTPKNVQTQEERATLVYRAKVLADNPEQVLKPGMPVDVVLDTEQARPPGVAPGKAGQIPEKAP